MEKVNVILMVVAIVMVLAVGTAIVVGCVGIDENVESNTFRSDFTIHNLNIANYESSSHLRYLVGASDGDHATVFEVEEELFARLEVGYPLIVEVTATETKNGMTYKYEVIGLPQS